MAKKNPQPCKNQNCDHVVNYSKTGYCYHCCLSIRKKPNRKPIETVDCKTVNCVNLVSSNSKNGLCKKCYQQKNKNKKPEKNITYICPNPTNNQKCLKGKLVNKWSFTQLIKNNSLCRSCAHIKGVETRNENGSYRQTEETKEKISKKQKEQYQLGERESWNKGLNAKIDDRVARTGKSRPGELNPMFGRSFRDIWEQEFDEYEFNEKIEYNSYLKSQSLLTFEDWRQKRINNFSAYDEYKRSVWHNTNKCALKALPNFDKRGKAGIEDAYHLDHIVPIQYGFEHNINAEYIGSMQNLWFIPWEINIKKGGSFANLLFLSEYYPISQYGFPIFYEMKKIMKQYWNFEEPLPKLKRISNEI